MVDEATRKYNQEYYLRRRKLQGKKPGSGLATTKDLRNNPAPSKPKTKPDSMTTNSAGARVKRLKGKIKTLEGALSQTMAELSEKRAAARETEKKNSDGKTTQSEKNASEDYREKHKEEIKAKEKKESTKTSSSSSSSGSSSSSSSSSSSDRSVEDLEARVIQIKSALRNAKAQLSNASQKHGQLAHSAITSEPNFNTLFARFQSAERNPSQ